MLVLKGGGVKGETEDRWQFLSIIDVTRKKIPIRPWFCRGLNRRVNRE